MYLRTNYISGINTLCSETIQIPNVEKNIEATNSFDPSYWFPKEQILLDQSKLEYWKHTNYRRIETYGKLFKIRLGGKYTGYLVDALCLTSKRWCGDFGKEYKKHHVTLLDDINWVEHEFDPTWDEYPLYETVYKLKPNTKSTALISKEWSLNDELGKPNPNFGYLILNDSDDVSFCLTGLHFENGLAEVIDSGSYTHMGMNFSQTNKYLVKLEQFTRPDGKIVNILLPQ